MDTSKHGGQARHDWLPVVIGCGLTVLFLILLPVVDSPWGTLAVLVGLALSPVIMFLVMRHMPAPSGSDHLRRRSCHEDQT